MLSKIPAEIGKNPGKERDLQILRAAIIAELDAINLYEQMAALAQDEGLKRVLMDVAEEEKTHFGEFQALLLKLDPAQEEELRKGKEEVEELTGK